MKTKINPLRIIIAAYLFKLDTIYNNHILSGNLNSKLTLLWFEFSSINLMAESNVSLFISNTDRQSLGAND